MKRMIIIAVAGAMMAGCGGNDAKPVTVAPPKVSKHDAVFNASVDKVLASYYQLKDAFVNTDSDAANKAGIALAAAVDSFKWGGIKDTSIVFLASDPLIKSIGNDAGSISRENNIEEKRKVFSSISENLYQLMQAIKYDNQVVYHQYCPMAFNDAGAFWLSNSADIKNPYFGDKMLECGEVKDSIAN